MIETSITLSKLVVAVLWTCVGALMVAAWMAWGVGAVHLATLLGVTSCVTSAGAATATVRRYAIRICFMIRASNMGADVMDGPTPVRLLRD